MQYQMLRVVFFRFMQPQEIGISSHRLSTNPTEAELLNKKVSEEMFEGIIREVVEEIGVHAEFLVKFLDNADFTAVLFLTLNASTFLLILFYILSLTAMRCVLMVQQKQ